LYTVYFADDIAETFSSRQYYIHFKSYVTADSSQFLEATIIGRPLLPQKLSYVFYYIRNK